jgi:predicted acylesterase/phospholipase RssA
MSIPGAFVPLELRGQLLADGGIARNLPVDVARQMGAEVIIAVNVGTPLMPRENLNSALNIAQQMINILTEQNVKQSLAELEAKTGAAGDWLADVLERAHLAGVGLEPLKPRKPDTFGELVDQRLAGVPIIKEDAT